MQVSSNVSDVDQLYFIASAQSRRLLSSASAPHEVDVDDVDRETLAGRAYCGCHPFSRKLALSCPHILDTIQNPYNGRYRQPAYFCHWA